MYLSLSVFIPLQILTKCFYFHCYPVRQFLKLARTLGALLEIDPVPGCRSMAHLPVEERESLELERTKVLCNTKSCYFSTLRVYRRSVPVYFYIYIASWDLSARLNEQNNTKVNRESTNKWNGITTNKCGQRWALNFVEESIDK